MFEWFYKWLEKPSFKINEYQDGTFMVLVKTKRFSPWKYWYLFKFLCVTKPPDGKLYYDMSDGQRYETWEEATTQLDNAKIKTRETIEFNRLRRENKRKSKKLIKTYVR